MRLSLITGIENPRIMFHDKIFLVAPFSDDKTLDFNVPSTGSGAFLIDHMESCHIVNEQMCWDRLKSVKCCENPAKTLGNLPTSHRQVKLCFG